MKEIQLTQGKVALVDDEDYENLNKWKWYAIKNHRNYYAVRYINKDKKTIFMHKEILKGIICDHRDRNGLNNQKENLRIATLQQNNMNRRGCDNSSSNYKGVTWDKNAKKWRPSIQINKKTIHLGSFALEVEAAKVYNRAALKYHGEFACLNQL